MAERIKKQSRWWIVDPIPHRHYSMAQAQEMKRQAEESGNIGFFVISSPADDEWACDWCNGDIRIVGDDGRPISVPMFDSNALCDSCVARQMSDVEKTLAASSLGDQPSVVWSFNRCGLPCCQGKMPRADIRIPA